MLHISICYIFKICWCHIVSFQKGTALNTANCSMAFPCVVIKLRRNIYMDFKPELHAAWRHCVDEYLMASQSESHGRSRSLHEVPGDSNLACMQLRPASHLLLSSTSAVGLGVKQIALIWRRAELQLSSQEECGVFGLIANGNQLGRLFDPVSYPSQAVGKAIRAHGPCSSPTPSSDTWVGRTSHWLCCDA